MTVVVVILGDRRWKLVPPLVPPKVQRYSQSSWESIFEVPFMGVVHVKKTTPYVNVFLTKESFRPFLWVYYTLYNIPHTIELTLDEMMVIGGPLYDYGDLGFRGKPMVRKWWNLLFSGKYHPSSKAGLGTFPDHTHPKAEEYRKILDCYYWLISLYRNRVHSALFPPDYPTGDTREEIRRRRNTTGVPGDPLIILSKESHWPIEINKQVPISTINKAFHTAMMKRMPNADLLAHIYTFLFSPVSQEHDLLPGSMSGRRLLVKLNEQAEREGVVHIVDPITKLVYDNMNFYLIRRGDMVVYEFDNGDSTRYNSDRFIWDGSKLVTLHGRRSDSDYGSIPSSFPINEFGTTWYFSDVVNMHLSFRFNITEYTFVREQIGRFSLFILHKMGVRRRWAIISRKVSLNGEADYRILDRDAISEMDSTETEIDLLLSRIKEYGIYEDNVLFDPSLYK